jgi:TATA-binding protein-associated factor Taf7
MRAFSGGEELPENATKEQKQAAQEKMLKNMDDAGLNAVKTIIEKTLIKSYPNEKVDQLKVFGLKYMGLLMGKIFELNTAQYGK